MKKLIYLFAFLFILSCSKDNPTEPEVVYDPDPVGFYLFDIKTNIIEKMNVTGAKNGLKSYIKYEDNAWCDIKETGEDYSVWIKNLGRYTIEGVTHVFFDLELQPPSFIFESDYIKIATLNIEYEMNPVYFASIDDPELEYVYREFRKYSLTLDKVNKSYNYIRSIADKDKTGFTKYYNALLGLIGIFMKDGEKAEHKFEAVIAGAECFGQLRAWIKEIEAGN